MTGDRYMSRSQAPPDVLPSYFAFGVNHERAGIAQREPFELNPDQHERMVEAARTASAGEWLMLVTCNRTEVYGYGTPADADGLRRALTQAAGTPWPGDASFAHTGREAVVHVLEVAAGLRSQVLGDVQILAQVKAAYRDADRRGTVGSFLHRLMHATLTTAKRVKTRTDVSRGNPSVASLATRVARRLIAQDARFSPERPVRVAVLGAGDMGRAIATILSKDRRVRGLLSNRTAPAARAVADACGFSVVPWSDRGRVLAESDVVFVATSAREYVLHPGLVPAGATLPVLVVDLAVPRTVAPSLGEGAACRVLDLDALPAIDHADRRAQSEGLRLARRLCAEAARDLGYWEEEQRRLGPAIEVLARTFEAVRSQEVARHSHRFDARHHEQVELLTRSIVQKLMAVPLVRLKSAMAESADVERHIRCLLHLFEAPGPATNDRGAREMESRSAPARRASTARPGRPAADASESGALP